MTSFSLFDPEAFPAVTPPITASSQVAATPSAYRLFFHSMKDTTIRQGRSRKMARKTLTRSSDRVHCFSVMCSRLCFSSLGPSFVFQTPRRRLDSSQRIAQSVLHQSDVSTQAKPRRSSSILLTMSLSRAVLGSASMPRIDEILVLS